MKIVRLILVAVVAAVAAYGIWRTVWLPYECNIEQNVIRTTITEANRRGEAFESAMTMRQHIATVTHCLELDPTNVELWMEKAALARLVDDDETAVSAYRSALQFDHRPEIYWNIGVVEFNEKHRPEAIEAWAHACILNASFLWDLREYGTVDEVLAKSEQLDPDAGADLRRRAAEPEPPRYRFRHRGMHHDQYGGDQQPSNGL